MFPDLDGTFDNTIFVLSQNTKCCARNIPFIQLFLKGNNHRLILGFTDKISGGSSL